MKAEINNENKAKFFALYYDQVVLFTASFVKGEDLMKVLSNHEIESYGKKAYLTLKPLSQINDEDAVEVAKIIVKQFEDQPLSHIETACNCGVYFKNGYINIYPDFSFLVNHYNGQSVYQGPESILFAEHYLRSKGYALPYLGLSVEDLINAGWIKII